MKKLLFFLLLPLMLFGVSTENILALTWLNGFCKVNPKKRVCLYKKPSDYASKHFTLHGLWPQKKNYCSNEPMNLSKELLKILKKYMPAAKFGLVKHEWRKHGTCFGTDAKTYFLTSIKLTEQFNDTLIAKYFKNHMGESLSLQKLRFLFAKAFGRKSTRKFQMICKKGYIVEIRLNLKGNPIKEDLNTLINKANDMRKRQCQVGIIAPF